MTHIPSLHLPLLLLWIALTLWLEVALFQLSAAPCNFFRAPPFASEARSSFALIADPQLTDAGSYQRGLAASWPLRLVVEWSSDSFMRRAYAHAVQSLSADGELFLGDMFDTAAFGSDELFLSSLERFRSVFPPGPLRLFVPGNHDLGLLSAYSSQRRLRYTRYFGASDFEFESNRVPLRIIGINAPAVASGCRAPSTPPPSTTITVELDYTPPPLLPPRLNASLTHCCRFLSFCNKSSPDPDVDCPRWMQGPRGFADAHADSRLSMSV
jgi:hypothetical protein